METLGVMPFCPTTGRKEETMIGIYLIYAGAVVLFAAGIRSRKLEKRELFDKTESNYIKGVAAMMVLLAHAQNYLETNSVKASALKPFAVFGGVGVLLFFLLSGYGIFKGYANKQPTIRYWKNRLINVAIPAICISVLSATVLSYCSGKTMTFSVLAKDVLMNQWYVNVMLVEYLVFYVCWSLCRGNHRRLLVLSVLLSMSAGTVFLKMGLPARWYNGILLFPTGMILAEYEDWIIAWNRKIKWIVLTFSAAMFCITGILFTTLKGQLAGDLLKTLSGICLSLSVVMLIALFEVGNRVMECIGKRSLFCAI